MAEIIRILGIAGSLRRQSFNRAALAAAKELVPEGVIMDVYELDDLPLYNQDQDTNFPEVAVKFKQAIRKADAILFVTPEYNYSVSGVLKNAIDWASRPYGDSAWNGKPAAIMGASPGNLGTARAQYHLRQVLLSLNMFVVNRPEVMISNAENRFDANGKLTDEKTRSMIGNLVKGLIDLNNKMTTKPEIENALSR